MELDLQPGDVVKVLESAALGWVRARVIRVKSGGRVVVQSDQGREFTARGNQVRLIEPAGFRPQKYTAVYFKAAVKLTISVNSQINKFFLLQHHKLSIMI